MDARSIPLTRRRFLRASLGASGALLTACAPHAPDPFPDAASDAPAPATCDTDPFAGGTLLGVVPFVSTRTMPFHTPFDAGLDGRLYTDLSQLTPETLVTPNERFYVRTRTPDLLDPTLPWRIATRGLARSPRAIPIDELRAMAAPIPNTLLECSGNTAGADFGLMSSARWTGVALERVLALIEPTSAATRVLVSGFDRHSLPSSRSTPGASWVFALADIARAGAFLATEMNGVALPSDHGYPVRLVVPGWYGCTCIKWVDEIALVDDTEPATEHMREFASRTHQVGTPALARDFSAAAMDQAAMPVRIERWRVGDRVRYRVVGILWGGYRVTDALQIRFNPDQPHVPVAVCPPHASNRTWSLWSHPWSPAAPGRYAISLRVADPSVPTRRLDAGYYTRMVDITDA